MAISNTYDKDIGQVTYELDDQAVTLENGKFIFEAETLGNKKLTAKIEYGDDIVEITKSFKLLSATPPEVYTYTILNTYPHDSKAYTQGLEFSDGILFESTGKKGTSTLRKLNYETGEIIEQLDMDATVFGEGITILNNKIYQLTWQSGFGYVYDKASFKQLETFGYGESKEGWGLANDGSKIYKSDGTEKIWFLNPDNLAEEGYLEIVTNKSLFNSANELEYVDGKLYANVYGKESMMIIDAVSGAITGVVNFGGLKEKVNKDDNWDEQNSVLNGIAFHPEKQTFFVTGKNWDKLFEVVLRKK